MFGGLITIWFVAHYMSPTEQGLYYTVISILALQIFIELGFNYAVVRVIGHKLGQIQVLMPKDFLVIIARPEIAVLCARFLQQSIVISSLTIVLLTPVGLVYFANVSNNIITWQLWVQLVSFSAINILINTVLSIAEGVGFTAKVAAIRFWQATITVVFLWLGLWLGVKLHALIWSNAAACILVAVYIAINFSPLFTCALRNRTREIDYSERLALRSYIKKIAISGVSGYFIFQLFTPLLTLYAGPIDSGKFAMTLQIITSLNLFGLVPLTSSAPRLARLIGAGEVVKALSLFYKILYATSAITMAACIIVAAALYAGRIIGLDMVNRVLPLELFALMLFAAFANHLVFSIATYLRSFLDDPFWVLSVISALVGAVGAYFCIKFWGVGGAVGVYFVNCVFVGLGGAIYIFIKRKHG